METERTCLICLDEPQEENPLYLLSCGCKTAWFHRSCQMNWMAHSNNSRRNPLKCPTCKREVPMQLHYEYHPSFGEAQQKLRAISFLGAAESFLALSLWAQYTFATGIQLPEALLIPFQSILLLNLPILLHSEYDIMTSMNYIYYKNGFQVIYLVLYYFRRGWYNILSLPTHIIILNFISFLHLLIFAIQILTSRYAQRIPPINPFTPFVVGCDTIYADTLYFVKATTNSPKDNMTCVRRSPRLVTQQATGRTDVH